VVRLLDPVYLEAGRFHWSHLGERRVPPYSRQVVWTGLEKLVNIDSQ
jgi:hypothetical protein